MNDISAPETLRVPKDQQKVACDGGGAMGHPQVWYTFDGKDFVECGYCDRRFVKED